MFFTIAILLHFCLGQRAGK